ncbi:MAG: conjugal transfer protein TraF, partial [Planctomycetes bacterium]|nr:conjugal transfer protein TraF [Planctomycetota bacterium]
VRVGPFALGFAGYQYGSVDPVVDVGAGGFNSIATAGFNSVFSDGGGTGPIDPNNVGGQSAPTTPAGQSLATQLAALPGMTQDRAEAIAILGEQAGVDLSNPTLRDTINNITTATAQNTSAAPASAETLFFNNQTGVDVKTLTLLEIQMGYGHYFEEFNLGLGVAPKVLLGSTSVDRFALADFQNNQASDFIDDIDAFDFFGSSSDPGDTDVAPRFSFDAGAAWNATDFWRLGLVGKNIIPATFDLKNRTTTANNKVVVTNAGDVTIGPAVRAGTALHFLRDRIVLSADYDLLPQRSDLLTGFESQLAGAGVELTPIASDWFAPSLRAGIYKNLRGSKEDSVLTLGLGLRVLFVEFGFAVAQPRFIMDALKGLDENDLDKTPQRMNAAFTIGINTSF